MINVVIYARYSCDNQREESIEGQLRECRDFCKRHGFCVVNEYIDRALATASNIERVFENDPNLAKIGVTLTNVAQQLRTNQEAIASQHIPDFVTVQIDQPPPAFLEGKFNTSFRE